VSLKLLTLNEAEIFVKRAEGSESRASAAFDLPKLAGASEGFSGAEIEQAIVAGLFTAFEQKQRDTRGRYSGHPGMGEDASDFCRLTCFVPA
jgi:hypothetical protein